MTRASIIAAGRELGMARLSVAAVAARLGVSAAALYRHVQNRWHLESLVGESLLADLTLDGGPGDGRDVESRLLWFALTLHDFATDRPGLAGYALTLFPRGEAGLRLMETEASALRRCGLTEEAALVVSNAVATVTFSLVAAEERRRDAAAEDADGGFAAELLAATRRFESEPRLGAAAAMPSVSGGDYVRMLLAACVRGIVAALGPEPGRATARTVVAGLNDRLVRAGDPQVVLHPRTTPTPLEG